MFCYCRFIQLVEVWCACSLHQASMVCSICPTYTLPHSHRIWYMPDVFYPRSYFSDVNMLTLFLACWCIFLILYLVSNLLILPEVYYMYGIMAVPDCLLLSVYGLCFGLRLLEQHCLYVAKHDNTLLGLLVYWPPWVNRSYVREHCPMTSFMMPLGFVTHQLRTTGLDGEI
jgi:hypothetical protein